MAIVQNDNASDKHNNTSARLQNVVTKEKVILDF